MRDPNKKFDMSHCYIFRGRECYPQSEENGVVKYIRKGTDFWGHDEHGNELWSWSEMECPAEEWTRDAKEKANA